LFNPNSSLFLLLKTTENKDRPKAGLNSAAYSQGLKLNWKFIADRFILFSPGVNLCFFIPALASFFKQL